MHTQDNDENEYKSGDELLAGWGLTTREQQLEKAVQVLMEELNRLHEDYEKQSLEANLTNTEMFCSCSDAYRMGHAALAKRD